MKDQFIKAVNKINLVNDQAASFIEGFDNRTTSELWKKYFPKKKMADDLYKAEKILLKNKEAEAEFDLLKRGAYKNFNDKLLEVKSLKDELIKIASSNECLPEIGETWQAFAQTSSSTYNSQGWGATKYALVAAEIYAAKAKLYNVNSKIETINHSPDLVDFVVLVQVKDDIDVQILKNKPD